MSQEHSKSNGTRNGGLNKENLMKIHGPILPPRRTALKEAIMGVTVGSDGLIAINGRD